MSKKLEKAYKELGDAIVKEMESFNAAQLDTRIVEAEKAMQQVEAELEENVKYQEVKENKKALEEGKRSVNKHQKAVIQVALYLLGDSK